MTGPQHSSEHTEATSEPEPRLAEAPLRGDLAGSLLALQHTAGNRAVGRLLAGGRLQRARRRKPPKGTPHPTDPGVTVYPPGKPPKAEPRAVTGGYTETVAAEDELRYTMKPPVGGETTTKRYVGLWAHANTEVMQKLFGGPNPMLSEKLPEKLQAEYVIQNIWLPWYRRSRIDQIDREAGIIYELKPDTRRPEGEAQAKYYVSEMNRIEPLGGGRSWQWVVITYDQARLIEFLTSIGYIAPTPPLQTGVLPYVRNQIPAKPPAPTAPLGPAPAAAQPAPAPTFEPAPSAATKVSIPLTGFMRGPTLPAPPAAGSGGTPPPTAPPPTAPAAAPTTAPTPPGQGSRRYRAARRDRDR